MLAAPPETGALARVLSRGLDLLLPPRCLGCGRLVETAHSLCPDCWQGVAFLAPPLCARCGYPFETEMEDGALCAACTREPPDWDRARAVFRYDDQSRKLILGFKYSDRTEAAKAFGQWMARAGRELLSDADLVVPVPLHWTRLFTRRYNQSALLARAVSRLTGVSLDPLALVRRRRTPSQSGLDGGERRRNVRGAFAVPPRKAAAVSGRRIVLIDDVLTTGSTANACAAALRAAGAADIDVLTLARAASLRL